MNIPVSLATLSQLTEQQVFDHVVAHLRKQGKRSMLPKASEDTCAYRGSDGLKCAAGCLIADDEYNPRLEGYSWSGLVGMQLVPEAHQNLIARLQRIHDVFETPMWESLFGKVAADLNLKYIPRWST